MYVSHRSVPTAPDSAQPVTHRVSGSGTNETCTTARVTNKRNRKQTNTNDQPHPADRRKSRRERALKYQNPHNYISLKKAKGVK